MTGMSDDRKSLCMHSITIPILDKHFHCADLKYMYRDCHFMRYFPFWYSLVYLCSATCMAYDSTVVSLFFLLKYT